MRLMLAGALIIPALSACDNIPEDERFVDNPRPKVERKVVIYEFTGQRCTNCPDGAEAVHNLQTIFPGSVLAINVHPENTQYTVPLGGLDLTCKYSTFLYDHYKPAAFPAASINGAAAINNIVQWSTETNAAIALPAPATIDLHTEYAEANRELKVNYSISFNEYTDRELLVQIYIVENGIVGMQIANGRIERDYIHNHVLRTALFEDWGESFGTTFNIGEVITGDKSITIDDKWVAENCEVIAVVATTDHSVLQAQDAPLGGDSTPGDGDDNTDDNDDNADNDNN